MKITLEDGKYHISPLGNHDPGPKDRISIAKPEGEVKITDPMAAYYLAAAGGTWAKSSNLVSMFFYTFFNYAHHYIWHT